MMATRCYRALISSAGEVSGVRSAALAPGISLSSSSLRRTLSSASGDPLRKEGGGLGSAPVPEKVEAKREDDPSGAAAAEEDGGEHVNKATGEVGGPKGPEPTRYGDWERGGRCSDF